MRFSMIWGHNATNFLHGPIQERLQRHSKTKQRYKQVKNRHLASETLDEKYKDHPRQGNYADTHDCHISPDWLLIYRIAGEELQLIRTGSHAELFK